VKIAGIMGIAPESTVDYYRRIVAGYRERARDGSYPPLLFNCIDLKKMLALAQSGQLRELATFLGAEVARLAAGGAHFAALTANTAHLVFDEVRDAASIPLISIVETARDAAQAQGLRRVGLLGTLLTMEARFFPDVFSLAGIEVVIPPPGERAFVDKKYLGELVPGIFKAETRAAIVQVIERMRREQGIDGLVLGGTELPLLMRDAGDLGIPVLDTTVLHVERIVEELLS
jgi:aspartate racemase